MEFVTTLERKRLGIASNLKGERDEARRKGKKRLGSQRGNILMPDMHFFFLGFRLEDISYLGRGVSFRSAAARCCDAGFGNLGIWAWAYLNIIIGKQILNASI